MDMHMEEYNKLLGTLLPCPFCGANNKIKEYIGKKIRIEKWEHDPAGFPESHYIVCFSCGVMGAPNDNYLGCVDAWNKRV